MPSSEMCHRVDLVRTYVLEEFVVSVFRVVRINKLGITLDVTSKLANLLIIGNIVHSSLILSFLKMEAIHSSKTLVLTISTWCHTPEKSILHSHHCDNLKFYIAIVVT
jgi:hypothetical protein